jgi:hypothetical protein
MILSMLEVAELFKALRAVIFHVCREESFLQQAISYDSTSFLISLSAPSYYTLRVKITALLISQAFNKPSTSIVSHNTSWQSPHRIKWLDIFLILI